MANVRLIQAESCHRTGNDASTILPNNGNILPDEFGSVFPSMRRRPSAEEVLNRNIKEAGGISPPEIVRRAEAKGFEIARNTINFIKNGQTSDPGIFTIEKIAAGLDKPAVQLAAEFLGVSINDPAFKGTQFAMLWDFYNGLTPTQKQRADQQLEVLMLALSHIKGLPPK